MPNAHAHTMELVHTYAHDKTRLATFLDAVERVGNKVPHPIVIFVLLIGIVILLSHVCYPAGASVTYRAVDPNTNAIEETTTSERNLLTADGNRFRYASVVQNVTNFTATGVIIVVMFGLGVAEAADLFKAMLRKLEIALPAGLTYVLIALGILSRIAADARDLVLVLLAAAEYLKCWPPFAGGPCRVLGRSRPSCCLMLSFSLSHGRSFSLPGSFLGCQRGF